MATMTLAELQDVVSQIGVTMKESARESLEMMKASARESLERMKASERESAEIRKRTDLEIAKIRAEAERHREEAEHYRKESERYRSVTDRRLAHLDKNVGGLNGSIGEIVEMIIIPGVMGRVNAFGHNFTKMSPRVTFKKPDDELLTEIDLILENSTETMLVEVKTQFSIKWVKRHLKRLELMRKHEDDTHVKGVTLYAAVAGVHFDKDALDLAVENGMYIIEIDEDNERIKINPPKTPGTW